MASRNLSWELKKPFNHDLVEKSFNNDSWELKKPFNHGLAIFVFGPKLSVIKINILNFDFTIEVPDFL